MTKPVTFTTSGTVQAQDGLYLTRQADEELFQLCRRGEYAYILTSRQMGKSSLMVATAERLQGEGVQTAIVDLQRLGAQTTTTDKWYFGLLTELARKLRLLPQLMTWWEAHTNLGEAQRLVQFLEDEVLPQISERLVVFVDEIDSTLSLDFTDDFFIALRYCFTARAENPDFEKLSFVLIGVATPSELIADQKRTPFNIGTLVELDDFTLPEALPLAAGLGLPEAQAQQLLGWILQWTGGHPYLTQRVCEAVVQQPQSVESAAAVDELMQQLFLGEQREQDNNLQFVNSMLTGRAPNGDVLGVLSAYRAIRRARPPVRDEDQSLVKAHLKLSGLVKRVGTMLQVRNPIYQEVFDHCWLREQWPETWWERMKPAMPIIGGLTAGIFMLGSLSMYALGQRNRAEVEALNAEIRADSLTVENLMAAKLNFEAWLAALELGQRIQEEESVSKSRLRSEVRLQAISVLREIYNAKGPLQRNILAGHTASVNSVSFSSDGQTLASASADGTVKIWDLSGRELQTLNGHTTYVNSVSFSPDGRTLASAGADGTVKLWDLSGRELQTLNGHTTYVNSVSFSPDGQTLASASADGTVQLWDPSGRRLQTFTSYTGGINSASFSPDGQTLASASADGTVQLWDINGRELRTFAGYRGGVNSVSFSPDGQTLASASADGKLQLWDLNGQELQTRRDAAFANGVSFSPDGQTLASASEDGTVKLWDVNGQELQTLQDTAYVNNVSFSPDGQTLACASADGTVKLWDLRAQDASERELQTLEGYSVSFSPDGQTLASASADDMVKLWDLSGRELQTLNGHTTYVSNVSFSPDGRTLASASADGSVKLWDLSGRELQTLNGHTTYVHSVSFSPDGQTLASASADGTVKLWDLSGRELQTLNGHTNGVVSVSFSPVRQTLASASWDGAVKLWDLSGRELQTLNGHMAGVVSVSFSPVREASDGLRPILASASYDGTVRLWDVHGRELHTLQGHAIGVNSVGFSPDGQILASASEDGTVKLWDLSGRELQTLEGHPSEVGSVHFAPDSQTLASASADGTIILWNFNLEDLMTKSCDWLRDYMTNPSTPLEHQALCQDELPELASLSRSAPVRWPTPIKSLFNGLTGAFSRES